MNREDALYRYGIPCLIFFKIKSPCSACDEFRPVWEDLCEDRLFQGKINFVIYSFGTDPNNGKTYSVGKEYEPIINEYGKIPIFLIHLPQDEGIIDLGHGPSPRTFDTMKQTIISALSSTKYRL